MSIDPRILIERILEGDSSSARALVDRFQGVVYAVCFRMLRHRQDAEDVTQEVFFRVFRHLASWDATRPFKPWLITIAVNRCRVALTKRTRTPTPSENIQHLTEPELPEEHGVLEEEIQLALQSLREEYRTCFILYHQQELSCSEIGEIIDCPEGTVKTWLYRARKELAEWLKRRDLEHCSYSPSSNESDPQKRK